MKRIKTAKIRKRVLVLMLAVCTVLVSALLALPSLAARTDGGTPGSSMHFGLAGLSDPVTVSSTSVIPTDYVYFGRNQRGTMIWRVLSSRTDRNGNEGYAFLMAEYLEPRTVSGISYDMTYRSYFTDEEWAALASSDADVGDTYDAFGVEWSNAASSGRLFAPTAADFSPSER